MCAYVKVYNTLIHSHFIYSLILSFIHSFCQSVSQSVINSFIRSFFLSFFPSFFLSFFLPFFLSFFSFIQSFSQSIIHRGVGWGPKKHIITWYWILSIPTTNNSSAKMSDNTRLMCAKFRFDFRNLSKENNAVILVRCG